MSILRRASAMKMALNFIAREAFPSSSGGFPNIRVVGGVSIPRPPPTAPRVFSRGFSEYSGVNNDPKPKFIIVDEPKGTRDEIIDNYIKTLAQVVGSEDEARKRMYSVSTRHYFAFGCMISEELANKLEQIPNVRWVLPHSYADPKTKTFGGEPFINGKAVPYDPKYHEEWVRNNARGNENHRHRNMDRSRNFERRREMQQNASRQQLSNNTYEAPQGNTMQGAPGRSD